MLSDPEILKEPDLEFGNGGRDIDIRMGLTKYGPLEPERVGSVRIGIVGTAENVDGFAAWVQQCQIGLPARKSRQPNLFLPFPGLGNDNPFRCRFEIDTKAIRKLPLRDIERVIRIRDRSAAVREAVTIYADQTQALLESSSPPDVVICTLAVSLIERVVSDITLESDDAEPEHNEEFERDLDFRDLLKARTLSLTRPTQLAWPTTWNDSQAIRRRLSSHSWRRVQDPATRAWNFFNALYYKAGHIPWRLPRDPSEYHTSYIGVSFYKDASGQRLLTSTAQMFDERGQGLIIRGGRACTDKDDRRPYLAREDAYDLLLRSLRAYHNQHRHWPARVVLYKSSRFEPREAEGFEQAITECGISLYDMLWVSESTPLRLLREGGYPPLRGTLLSLGDSLLLYTRGSVPYFRTYPGLYIPQPLELRCHRMDSSAKEIASETLALTKMNWNSTQFDGASPITLRAARQVGRVLKHVSVGVAENSDYRRYI